MIKKASTRERNDERTRTEVLLPARPQVSVTCPVCWTEQRAERDICYHCGAHFVYASEKSVPREAS